MKHSRRVRSRSTQEERQAGSLRKSTGGEIGRGGGGIGGKMMMMMIQLNNKEG